MEVVALQIEAHRRVELRNGCFYRYRSLLSPKSAQGSHETTEIPVLGGGTNVIFRSSVGCIVHLNLWESCGVLIYIGHMAFFVVRFAS